MTPPLPPCPRFDGKRLDAGLLKTRFRYFLDVLWHVSGRVDVAPLGEVDLDMADWIDAGPGYRGIRAFRGVGKTDMFTAGYTAFRHFQDCQTRIVVVSKSYEAACAMIEQTRTWYSDIWFLRHLHPDKGRKDKDNMFDVGGADQTKNRSLLAIGVDGMITGKRSHLIIPDDIETPENTKTVEARELLKRKTSEFKRISSFGDQNPRGKSDMSCGQGEIVAIGTPHHEESVYDGMIEMGLAFRDYPIMLPPRGGDFARSKIGCLAPIIREMTEAYEAERGPIEDESTIVPTIPERFGREAIVSRMADGAWSFMMQEMMISKGGIGFRPLRLSDLIVPDFDFHDRFVPVWIKWGLADHNGSTARTDIERVGLGSGHLHRQIAMAKRDEYEELVDIRMSIDPSGSGEDETAWAIAGEMAGYVWVLDVGGVGGRYGRAEREHGGSDRVIADLAARARNFGVRVIQIEDADGDEMYAKALQLACDQLRVPAGSTEMPRFKKSGWSCSVEAVRIDRSANKPGRIVATLDGVLQQHRLVVHPSAVRPSAGVPRHYELQYQLSAILPGVKNGGIKHDDRVEALAMVVKQFKDALASDEKRLAERVAAERKVIEEDEWNRMMGLAPDDAEHSVVRRV